MFSNIVISIPKYKSLKDKTLVNSKAGCLLKQASDFEASSSNDARFHDASASERAELYAVARRDLRELVSSMVDS
jgi:hypothetical protein